MKETNVSNLIEVLEQIFVKLVFVYKLKCEYLQTKEQYKPYLTTC